MGVLGMATFSYSRVILPESAGHFYNLLDQHPLAVVHLIKIEKNMARPVELDKFKEVFRDVSNEKDYRAAEIAFIGVNIIDMPQLERAFKIGDGSEILLFHRGAVVQDEKGQDVRINGYVDADELENFIEKYLGGFIDQAIQYFKNAKQEYKSRYIQQQPQQYYTQPVTTQRTVYYDTDYNDDYYLTPGYGYYGAGYPWGLGIGFGAGWGAGRWGGRGYHHGGGRGGHGGGHRGGGGGHHGGGRRR